MKSLQNCYKILFKSVFTFLFVVKAYGQCTSCGPQLVNDGGFETPSGSCNVADIQLYSNQSPVQNWYGTEPYSGSAGSTPDYYYPSCAGTYTFSCQTGSGFAGIFVKSSFPNGREYIQTQLASPLIAGHTYCYSMTVRAKANFTGTTVYGSDGIGAWFESVGQINITTMNGGNQFLGAGSTINATPQIQNPAGNVIGTTCTTVSGQFCAQGGETWLVIGNFRTDAGTTLSPGASFGYLMIDNVSLQESCTSSPLNVTINPPPTVCSGACTTLTATATGGSGTYTYSWTPGGQTTNTVSVCPLVTTTYTLVTTSTSACSTPLTNTTTVTVNVGGSTSIVVTPTNAAICSSGSTILTASGATSYTWSPATGLSSTTGATVTANPSASTAYTVTGATGGCTGTTTVAVTVNSSPTITVNNPTYCTGGNAVLTANGANTYTWSPATGLSATTGSSVTASPTVTTTYTITGTSAAGCVGTQTALVSVVTNPTITCSPATICNGSTTTLTANGVVTYTWSPATGLSSTTGATVTASPTVTTTYTISGNAGTCTTSATTTVTVNPLPTVTANSATICAGNSATLTATGASTYTWNPGTGLSGTTGTSVTANPTVTTNYTVTGTSTLGCLNTATLAVTVNPLPTVSVNNASICNGGSATLTATGASTYTWSPATGLNTTTGTSVIASPSVTTIYTINGASVNGCTATTVATVTVNPAPTITVNTATICAGSTATLNASGALNYTWSPAMGLSSTNGSSVTATPTISVTYTITGASVNGCTASVTDPVTVNPLPTLSVNNASYCSGGNATLFVSGANTYTWSPATGLSSVNAATVTASPNTTTIYTVTGSTANSCTAAATSTVTVNASPTITVNNAALCAGGSATLTAAGATTYTWSPATGLNATNGASVIATPTVTTNYTVTGSTGTCTAAQTLTVTINPVPVANAGPDKTICNGGSTVLSGSGGGTYLWSTGSSNASITVSPNVTTKYILTVFLGACSDKDTAAVIVKAPPVVNITSTNISCSGLSNGSAVANITGGTMPYVYNWLPGNINNPSINSLGVGTYTLTVFDSVGCIVTRTVSITQPSQLQAAISGNGNLCSGSSEVLQANATGGTPPYTYTWPGSSVTTSMITVSPTVATNYVVQVGDSKGCSASANQQVNVNQTPHASFSGSDTSCAPVSVTFTNTSLNATSYLWVFGNGQTSTSTNPTQVYNNPGFYSVTLYAISAAGCKDSVTKGNIIHAIAQPINGITVSAQTIDDFSPTAAFSFFSQNSISCFVDFGDGTSTNACNGTSVNHTYRDTGRYCATITSTNSLGCKKSSQVCVYVEPSFTFYIPNAFTPDGDGLNDTFTGYGSNFSDYRMYIFDRWGNKIYETSDYSKPWNGRIDQNKDVVQIDVYTYKIELKDVNGQSHSYSGIINLIK